MEQLLPYFLKMNGLLVAFYLTYYIFLRKTTFFNYNRWFLMAGLLFSIGLPFFSYTKIVWVEPTPIAIENTPIITQLPNLQIEPIEKTIDWNEVLLFVYAGITLLLVLKLMVELFSFFNIIKKGNRIKENKIILIDQNKNDNPFSFFNYIVFNSQSFNTEELEHIILHEKVHVREKHSIDVLVSKIFCALFWANPIIWLYQKTILQNLEYIADAKVFLKIENKIQYQKTLVKVVVHQHQLSITNQFYQSLIKKRIVMLQKQKTKQQNVWKCLLFVPLITGFIFLFQVKTIAQIKESDPQEFNLEGQTTISSTITKNTTDVELNELLDVFSNENFTLKIYDVKRNKNNEIIAIKIKSYNNNKVENIFERKSTEPIKPFKMSQIFDKNDKLVSISFEDLNETEKDNRAVEAIAVENVESDGKFWYFDNLEKNGKKAILIINGKIQDDKNKIKIPMEEDTEKIIEISAENFEKKYNQKAKKNRIYYEVSTKKVPTVGVKWDDAKAIQTDQKAKISDDGKILIFDEKTDSKNMLYIINGKEYWSNDLKNKKVNLDGSIIQYDIEESIKKFGEKGKNGVIEFLGDAKIENEELNKIDSELESKKKIELERKSKFEERKNEIDEKMQERKKVLEEKIKERELKIQERKKLIEERKI